MRILLPLMVVALLASGCSAVAPAEVPDPESWRPQPLPPSLSELYPPKVEQPLYLFMMLELAQTFEGLINDVTQGDLEGARGSFPNFRVSWEKASQSVPEWSDRHPGEPVTALEQALSKGEPEAIMAAAGKVGDACHGCHTEYLGKVQHLYRWPSPGGIQVELPGAEGKVGFTQLMQAMGVSLAGISHDLAQGQQENAVKNARAFRAQFTALARTCESCHSTPRHYYVDQELMTMVTSLEQAATATPPDTGKVAELSRTIGNDSCGRCHKVHLPPALAKHRPR